MLLAVVVIAGCTRTPARVQVDTVQAREGSDGRVAIEVDVRNVGGAPLLVHEVRASCGCRLRAGAPDALEPGAMATIVLACAPGADQSAVAWIATSDRTTPELAVLRPGPAEAASAPGLYFGGVVVGESAVRDLMLDPGAVVGAQPSRSEFTVEAGSATSVPPRVRFTPAVTGVVRGGLRLASGAVVPLVGVGTGVLAVYPAELTVGPGRSATATVMAVGADGVPSLAADWPSGVTGELRAVESGREYRLTARVAGRSAADAAPAIALRAGAGGPVLVTVPVVRLDG